MRAFRRNLMADYGEGTPLRGFGRSLADSSKTRRVAMRSQSNWVLGSVTAFTLAGCAAPGPTNFNDEQATAGADSQLMSSRIRNWSAPNDHTLFFEAADGTRYRAETLGPC